MLKAEIARVARKEVRAEVEALRKASTQHRSAIATLRRQIDALEKELRRVGKRAAAAPASPGADDRSDDASPRRRFSASRLAAHRGKLGLSAAAYGQLLGLSGQTIYNWEQGKSRPNGAQLQQIAAVRALSRSAVLEQLESGSPV